ncbi:hypothetical protein [Deinococcus humi]|uniref:Anti-sigma factor n=1 Tax=Deinococcus humi TaxID=662880 RepID=A0A7W8NHH8_9DEIO|nr:hypothetical protein [Deinococcus humi]MBB5365895.1 hypothetical protein [Deinococcus humi]GGO38763.1 hypothetical protein GCM10008949_45860 [Deinococcus humi]
MNAPHPERSVLRAYAVGDLSGQVQRQTESHLLSCGACRAQVVAWREEFATQVESLPSAGELPPLRRTLRLTAPASASRGHTPRLPSSSRRSGLALPVGLALLCAAAIGWGGWQQTQVSVLRAEQRQVAGWLAQPGVSVLNLQARDNPSTGHLLLLPTREVLFVLPPPAPGKVYQVWVASNWKRGDPLTPSTRSTRGVLGASVGSGDYVCVSLEDERRDMTGQTRPTLVLGWTSL